MYVRVRVFTNLFHPFSVRQVRLSFAIDRSSVANCEDYIGKSVSNANQTHIYVVPPWTQRTLMQWPERKTKNIVHNILIDKYIVWDSFFFVCPIAICSTGNVWRHIFFFCCEYAMTIWTKIACSVNRYYIYVFLVYFLFSSAIVEKGFWLSDPTHPNNMSIDPYVRVECGYCGITNTDSG